MSRIKSLFLAVLLCLSPLVYAGPVDINTADAATLDKEIKGVGPALAKAIVDYRGKNGPFKSVDDLAKVKGVGPKLIANNKDKLTASTK